MSHAPVGGRSVRRRISGRTGHRERCRHSQGGLQQLTVRRNQPSGRLADQHSLSTPSSGERPAFTQEKRYLHQDGTVLWGGDGDPDPAEQMHPDHLAVVLENIDPIRRHAEQPKLSTRVYDNLSKPFWCAVPTVHHLGQSGLQEISR